MSNKGKCNGYIDYKSTTINESDEVQTDIISIHAELLNFVLIYVIAGMHKVTKIIQSLKEKVTKLKAKIY